MDFLKNATRIVSGRRQLTISLSVLTIPSSICFEISVACVQLGAGVVVASGYSSR